MVEAEALLDGRKTYSKLGQGSRHASKVTNSQSFKAIADMLNQFILL